MAALDSIGPTFLTIHVALDSIGPTFLTIYDLRFTIHDLRFISGLEWANRDGEPFVSGAYRDSQPPDVL